MSVKRFCGFFKRKESRSHTSTGDNKEERAQNQTELQQTKATQTHQKKRVVSPESFRDSAQTLRFGGRRDEVNVRARFPPNFTGSDALYGNEVSFLRGKRYAANQTVNTPDVLCVVPRW